MKYKHNKKGMYMKSILVKMGLFVLSICVLTNLISIILVYDYRYEKKANEQATETPVVENEIILENETNEEIDVVNEVEAEPIVEDESAFYLSDYERNIAECIVMGESKGETYGGQLLVAQSLFNACLKDGLQPSEVRVKYKYSGWDDAPSQSVKDAVSAVFDDGYKIVDEPILYFYAPKYCKGGWHETQDFVIELGGHRFFAEWEK